MYSIVSTKCVQPVEIIHNYRTLLAEHPDSCGPRAVTAHTCRIVHLFNLSVTPGAPEHFMIFCSFTKVKLNFCKVLMKTDN
jgi:hypothetical protein